MICGGGLHKRGLAAIPKVIWFLWFQGLENAPPIVRTCHESWVARNPGWRVITLDEQALRGFTSVDYAGGNIGALSIQHRSALLRLDLLACHGGLWVDATCFCVRPLDEWLAPNLGSGFFAFHRPGPDRILSSWFLASAPRNRLVSRLYDRLLAHWSDHRFRNDQRQFLVKVLTRLLRQSPRTRAWWFSRPLRDWLAIHPYYMLSYGFEKLIRDDPECARIWDHTPKISADGPHRLYEAGLLAPVTAELRAEIDQRDVPVYKTTWRIENQAIPADSTLGYLLRQDGARP
jgi:hypothetical protein